MTARRSRGDGGLSWDQARQRWVAAVTVGYSPAGKRIVRRASGRTRTEARTKLKQLVREHDDGVLLAKQNYTVQQAVQDWLEHGLGGRDASTRDTLGRLAHRHVIPALGGRKLRELSAEDVDRWLAEKARMLSTSTVARIKSILARSITRAQARDKVARNVVLLCGTPTGRAGRPSQALTFDQAQALLEAAPASTMGAYVVVSLLTGARTEELRALTWSHVDLAGDAGASPPVPPHVRVWRSVRTGGDTKTRGSRRTIALPQRCVEVLEEHRERQRVARAAAGERRADHDLVFATEAGTVMDAANVRRDFRRVAVAAGLDDRAWSPRELRHSFVSLLSDGGVPIEQIARLIGHAGGSKVTEAVYRKQLRPVIDEGATAMDRVFPGRRGASYSDSYSARPGIPRRPGPEPQLGS
jgi:integrase